MAIGGGPALVVKIVGDTAGLNNAMGDATKSVDGFGGALGGLPIAKLAVGATVATAVAAGLWEVGKAGANAAAEEDAFAKAIAGAGAATGDWVKQSDAAIAAGQALAFTDSEVMAGLQSLTTATGDMTKATGLLTTAEDVARFAKVDLATASDAVAKAYTGNDKALRALIPGLEKGATGYETIANASKAAEGQADAFSKSGDAASMMLKDSFSELVEEIGKALLPAFQAIMPVLKPVIGILTTLIKAILPVLIPFIKVLAKGLEVVASVLELVAKALAWVINKIKEFLKPLADAVGMIGKLDFLPGGNAFSTGPAVQAAGRSVRAGAGSTSTGPFTVNIYGDPAVIEARVTKALRDYTRRNGEISLFSPSRL